MIPDPQLGAIFKEAMRIWDAQKADGVPRDERIAGLERTLRAAWPRGRTEPWKFLCEQCEDRGLIMADCPGVQDASCGRVKAHLPHDFGRPCWCEAGRRFKPKQRTAEDAVDAAAKVGRPMTKAGRW